MKASLISSILLWHASVASAAKFSVGGKSRSNVPSGCAFWHRALMS